MCMSSPEFELVTTAMYTDPSDQSVWMYHRWLVGSGKFRWIAFRRPYQVLPRGHNREILEHEIAVIQELLDEQPDSKCKFD